jgi:quinol monooxygenase YgiN
MGHLEVHAHMKIRPGQLEGFTAQAAELMQLTREKDTQTIRYDWFINADATECEVHEAYLSGQGLIEHNTHIVQARAILFEKYAYDHRMTAFGEVSRSSWSWQTNTPEESPCTPSSKASKPRRLSRRRAKGVTSWSDIRVLERLTASDLFLLLWEDFGWSTDIGGLAILDGTQPARRRGSRPCRRDPAARRAETALVPRFRQLLHRPRLGLGWPAVVDAPSFDLADHIRVHPLAAPGDQDRLLQTCQQLARRPFDPARPAVGAVAAARPARPTGRRVLKLHHVLADGPAAMAAFGALLDQTAEAPDVMHRRGRRHLPVER